MKRLVFIAIMLVMVVFLCSCSNNLKYDVDVIEDDTSKGKDRIFKNTVEFSYIEDSDGIDKVEALGQNGNQTYLGVYNGQLYLLRNKPICRFNTITGNKTYICPDPLCTHKTVDCPFYSFCNDFYFWGNSVFYTQDYQDKNYEWVRTVVEYNMSIGTKKVLRNREEGFYAPNMVFYGDGYYYTDIIRDKDTNKYKHSFCYQNTLTKEITVLDTQKVWRYNPRMAFDDKLYIYDLVDNKLIYRDLKTGEDYDVCDNASGMFKCDGYFICTKYDSATNRQEIIRCNYDGSEQQSLGVTDAKYIYVTNNYIYYTTENYVQTKVDENGKPFYVNMGDICRMKHDGTGKETVFEPDIEEGKYCFWIDDYIVMGRYIYAQYHWLDVIDGETVVGKSFDSKSYVRYDTVTGERYYIDFTR